jgi:hypothetical protein
MYFFFLGKVNKFNEVYGASGGLSVFKNPVIAGVETVD